ncbi:hypothetical protein UCRPA7_714 [Phaeoacremonium minimum UCRPA7]|uniref:Thioredoxin domain-containing protein n=1 Tax=Phaeoacremonium minimum (strain UCR-PA7) TaxID=1286976 RepID=R8BXK7_PHAM7|nr:hypothetical protein UCRPA7_714 [Phaeoacremonium minimum UCRPA7]EOO04014.1 hypothetical protein UCRPA7_714 [Phaeoacremonium minimum UCRPA7]
MADVLSWDELQGIVSEYDTVFVMAYLPDSPPSARGLKIFDEYSRKVLDARFLTFDSTTPSGLKMVKKLQIKFAPMTFAFKNGVQTGTYTGEVRQKIHDIIESIASIQEDDDLQQLQQQQQTPAWTQPEELSRPPLIW